MIDLVDLAGRLIGLAIAVPLVMLGNLLCYGLLFATLRLAWRAGRLTWQAVCATLSRQ